MKGAVEKGELALLQEETLAQIEAGPDREPASDFVTRDGPTGEPHFFRIQFLTDKLLRNDSMLLAIAHPRILELTEELLGKDWTTYASAMVFKGTGGGPEIALHRDTFLDVPPGTRWSPEHQYFNADMYMDRASPTTGCLRVIPGSHRIAERDQIKAAIDAGLDQPGLIDVPMEPGDVLFHDARLLHGSLPTPPGSPLRRVLYYSYQSARMMAEEGVLPGRLVPRSWVAQQINLMAHAVERRAASPHTADGGRPYEVPLEWREECEAVSLDLRPVAGTLPWEGADANPPSRP